MNPVFNRQFLIKIDAWILLSLIIGQVDYQRPNLMRLYCIIIIDAQCTQKLGDYSCLLQWGKQSINSRQRCPGTRTSTAASSLPTLDPSEDPFVPDRWRALGMSTLPDFPPFSSALLTRGRTALGCPGWRSSPTPRHRQPRLRAAWMALGEPCPPPLPAGAVPSPACPSSLWNVASS